MSLQPLSEDVPAPVARSRLSLLLASVLTLLLMGLTYLYWQGQERGSAEQLRQALDKAADHVTYNLRDRMAAYELVLRGVKGYFDGSESIDRQEFQAYIQALQLEEKRPGLQGISLLSWVTPEELPSHAADMRQRGFGAYPIWPSGLRAHYAPITHIEPLVGDNLKSLGFDVATLPTSRAALEQAAASGQLALSGKLTLAQDADRSAPAPALVMYLPLYDKHHSVPSGAAPPQGRLNGWVAARFRAASVVQSLANEFDAGIALQIYDGSSPSAATWLYGSAAPAGHGLEVRRHIELGGRQWTLVMQPLPDFLDRYARSEHGWIAALGVAASLLLGWLAWLLATGRERAMGLAHRMTQALRSTRDDLESTLSAVPDLLFEVDQDGRILHYRSARSELLAVPPEVFLGQRLDSILPPAAAAFNAAIAEASAQGYSRGKEYELVLGQEHRWFELSVARKEGAAGEPGQRFIALARDITERKQAQAHTHELAYYDALTGLPNRRLLLDRVQGALATNRRTGQMGALLFIDLDNFKHINDARGHAVGDALLVQVAQRLHQQLRAQDLVARLGGDEFVVLLQELGADPASAGATARQVAEKLRSALETPHTIGGHLYSSSTSIGVTLFPESATEVVDDLLREADTAMYRAKGQGRNQVAFFEPAMQAQAQEHLALEQDLKQALAANQLAAHVQPQVDAAGAVVGGELLMRWQHPVRGNVPPDRFIPVAESSALILHLGDWMLRQACQALARLQAAGQGLVLSVNVSPRQFRQDDFVARLAALLQETGAPAAQLVLEVTEGLLIEHWEDTTRRMTELVQIGVRFSLDDFGTGYSSLAYLKKLPLFELKIDKSFVQDIPDDPNDTAIVQAILSIARHMHLRVVAEGVETCEQADFLIAHGCDGLQGYLFARPEPLEGWLQRVV